ncbi:MAG: hypothetical protein HY791_01960 [Deltaproteobacteria bacterium]|nr:hypothetical protein [Deltaproteobacteria bacterium]
MSRARASASLAWLALGCSGEHVALIAPDLPENLQSLAVLIQSTDGSARGSGLLPFGGSSLRISSLDPELGERALVVGFADQDLARVPMPDDGRAEQNPVRPASPNESLLPAPAWAGSGIVEELTRLTPTTAPPLHADWLGACRNPCDLVPTKGSKVMELGPRDRGHITVAVSWPDDPNASLLLTADGTAFRVTTSSVATLGPFASGAALGDADEVTFEDGTIWIASESGAVFGGRAGESFELLGQGPRRGRLWAAGGMTDSGKLMVMVSQTGKVEAFDGRSFQTIHEEPPQENQNLGVHWLGPDRYVVAFTELDRMVWIDHGVVTIDRSIPRPLSFADIPGFGLVLGTEGEATIPAGVFLRVGDVWVDLGVQDATAYSVRNLWPLDQGFLFGGIRGYLSFYRTGVGACAGQKYAKSSVDYLTRLGTSLLLIGRREFATDPIELVVVDLDEGPRKAPRCLGVR